MYKTKTEQTTTYNFDSIMDFYSWTNTSKVNPLFANYPSSQKTESPGGWTGSTTYQEAEELLLHGWTPAAEKMTVKLTSDNVTPTKRAIKSYYDVAGGQVSVSRYLTGLPTSMINRKAVKVKEKVVVINKDVSYNSMWSPDKMLIEGIKALEIIQAIEATGARVRLNIVTGGSSGFWEKTDTNLLYKICVKRPDQRLNVSTMAFAIAHPSMHRRMFFKALEVTPETTAKFIHGYGVPLVDNAAEWVNGVNEHFIPKQITSMEKFISEFVK